MDSRLTREDLEAEVIAARIALRETEVFSYDPDHVNYCIRRLIAAKRALEAFKKREG